MESRAPTHLGYQHTVPETHMLYQLPRNLTYFYIGLSN